MYIYLKGFKQNYLLQVECEYFNSGADKAASVLYTVTTPTTPTVNMLSEPK